MNRKALISAALLVAMGCGLAQAQPAPGPDPYGYYSQYDRNGYYDRDGRYRQMPGPGPAYGAPPGYYEQGRYEAECSRGNAAAGTIFGALAGGILGSLAGRGQGGAVIGGAILGGVLGNVISRDIACEDQPYAFRTYADGLNGDLGRRYDWRHDRAYGHFTPMREFRRDGLTCRTFSETSYRPDGRSFTHSGTACRQNDGNWRFD